MDVHRLRGHEAVLVHQADAIVVGGAPHPGVGGDGDAQFAGHLEGGLLGEGGVARDVEGELEAEHVVAVDAAGDEVAELRRGGPLRGCLLDVAVGQDEAAGHGPQGVHGGVGVVHGLQAVRPVDDGGHARVEGLHRGEPVAGVDVLGAELPAVFQVVPDEVLGEGPVGAVAAHRGLPHVAVRVDHARHHDAARGVDLHRPVGDRQSRTDRRDPVVHDEHVGVREDLALTVDGQHGPAPQDDGPPRGECLDLIHR